jgi:hypothetical protein
MPAAVEHAVMHSRLLNLGATALLYAIVAQPCLAAPANAATPVVFKIWNNTTVPITALYDKDSRQDFWGINDLQQPLKPGHFFYIKFEQTSYAHCPSMSHDVKLVFATRAVKVLSKVAVCKFDVHVNRP